MNVAGTYAGVAEPGISSKERTAILMTVNVRGNTQAFLHEQPLRSAKHCHSTALQLLAENCEMAKRVQHGDLPGCQHQIYLGNTHCLTASA
jgi:hypothetical protein